MNSSFLYHTLGLYTHKCTGEEYKGKTIILHVHTLDRLKVCLECGKCHLFRNGTHIKDFTGLPNRQKEGYNTHEKVQRYKCRMTAVARPAQENIPFATGSRTYTHRFAAYVVYLLRGMTLQDTANLLDISWDTVKEIHSIYLQRHYYPPLLEGAECIGIDEFAVRKGRISRRS